MPLIQHLHNLQGHLSGCHALTFDINVSSVGAILVSRGRKSQIFGPIFFNVSSPQNTVLTLAVMKSFDCLKL